MKLLVYEEKWVVHFCPFEWFIFAPSSENSIDSQ